MSKKGGNKRKRTKKQSTANRTLILKDVNQCYAEVLQALGNNRFKAFCYDGKERVCKVRGKMIRKVWINVGDIIIVALRDFQDTKCDVIHKYFPEEVRLLKRQKEIPSDKEIEKIKNPDVKPSSNTTNGPDVIFDDL